MDQFNIVENVDTLFHSLENFTQKEGVIGKPVTQGDKTFLPVVSVTIGYGGGNANMSTPTPTPGGSTASSNKTAQTGTGALGLGAKLTTEGIIVIENQNVSMLPMNSAGSSQLMDKIPQIISGMTNKQSGQQQQQSQQPKS